MNKYFKDSLAVFKFDYSNIQHIKDLTDFLSKRIRHNIQIVDFLINYNFIDDFTYIWMEWVTEEIETILNRSIQDTGDPNIDICIEIISDEFHMEILDILQRVHYAGNIEIHEYVNTLAIEKEYLFNKPEIWIPYTDNITYYAEVTERYLSLLRYVLLIHLVDRITYKKRR